MGEFIKTRNPDVWDQLTANLKKTPQRAQTEAEQAQSLAESQIVNFLTQNMGGGDYAGHMIAAGDPIQMAMMLVPSLKAGKLIGGAGRTTGGVVKEIAKTAVTEMGINSLQTLVENPDAKLSDFEQMSLEYLMGTLGMAAINKGVSKVMRALPGNLPVPNEKNGSSGDAANDAAGTPPDSGAGAQATAAPAGVPKPETAPAQAAAAAAPKPDEVPAAVTAGGNTELQATWEGNGRVIAEPQATNVPQAIGVGSSGGASPPGFVAQQGGGQPANGSGASSMPPTQTAGSGLGSSSGGTANSAGGGAGTPLQIGGSDTPLIRQSPERVSSQSASTVTKNSGSGIDQTQGSSGHSRDNANESLQDDSVSDTLSQESAGSKTWNPKSKQTFKHIFLEHGEKRTRRQLGDRAASNGHQVGKFLNDEATAKALQRLFEDGKLKPGLNDFDLPPDISGIVILPDRITELPADKLRIIVDSDGNFTSAYPYNSSHPTSNPARQAEKRRNAEEAKKRLKERQKQKEMNQKKRR